MADGTTTIRVDCMSIPLVAPTYANPIVLEYQGPSPTGEWYYTFAQQDPTRTYFGLYIDPATQLMHLVEGSSATKITRQFDGLKMATEEVLEYNGLSLGGYKDGGYTLDVSLVSERFFATPGCLPSRFEAQTNPTGLAPSTSPQHFSLWIDKPICDKKESFDYRSEE